MSYTKQIWADDPPGETPITAATLDYIEQGIEDAAAAADTALETKADEAAVTAALALKADSTALALKANTSDVNTALATKADQSAVTVALAPKADTATVNAALALKADQSAVTAALAAKANTTYVDAQIASIPPPTLANLPAGMTITIVKSGGVWPARYSSRSDLIFAWKGPDPSPPIVSSGTAGMLNNVDYRLVTP